MENYIICEKKANQPRIHVKICQHRCNDIDTCQAFQDYIRSCPADETVKGSDAASLSQENVIFPTAA